MRRRKAQSPGQRVPLPPLPAIVCRLREERSRRGLSQADLAAATGLTRQAIGAIESGQYAPNTAIALRLARLLGCSVDDMFSIADGPAELPVQLLGSGTEVDAQPVRVALARVRGALVAHPLSGPAAIPESFACGDGLVSGSGDRVRLLAAPERIERTALLMGCDPAFGILATHVLERCGAALRTHFAPSRAALDAVAAGTAHLAGAHLFGPGGRDGNLPAAKRALARSGGLVVAFAAWEQGLMVPRGNPQGLRTVADLARRGVRFLAREPGSGSRTMLDALLNRARIPPAAIAGLASGARLAASHLDGARRVASGAADAALGLRAVASTCGLDFIALGQVQSDLIIPRDAMVHPVVVAVLEAINGRALRDELACLPGYLTERTGTVLADLPASA